MSSTIQTSESLPDSSNHQIDIETELSKQLEKLRQHSPKCLPISVHVLPTVDEILDDQFEERLLEASKQYTGKRMTVFPYHMGNSHWVGILIAFDSENLIERSEFIDPVKGSDCIPERVQQRFTRVFPNNILRCKTGIKLEDRTKSATLTVSNLLSAVQKFQSNDNSLLYSQDNGNSNSCSFDRPEQHLDKDHSNHSTNPATMPNEVNSSTLQKLQEQLSTGLRSLNISDEKILSERIRRAKERIQKYQISDETSDVEKEMNYLKQYERLQELAEKINSLKPNVLVSNDTIDSELQQLEAKLTADLMKLKIPNVGLIADRIVRSEQRIKEYREENRLEDVAKEQTYLNECQVLQKLAEDIRIRKLGDDRTEKIQSLKLSQLEQRLNNDLEKLRISDISLLPDRIRRSEQRIKEYQEENRLNDVEKEQKYLNECQMLQKLAEEIRRMQIDRCELRLGMLEYKLANELAKFKISDITILLEKILRLEKRVKEFEEEGRTDEAQNEANYLSELNKLKKLNEEISTLKKASSDTSGNTVSKLHDLENKLTIGMSKLKISNTGVLLDKIQRSEQRINEFREEGRAKEAETEELYLNELKNLKILVDKIDTLKMPSDNISSSNPGSLHDLENKLNQNLSRLGIRDITCLAVRIERSKQRIQEYEDEQNTDGLKRERTVLGELEELQKLSEKICKLTPIPTHSPSEPVPPIFVPPPPQITVPVAELPSSKSSYLEDLREDFLDMPVCAEKTTMELLIHYEQKLLKREIHSNDSESVTALLEKLQEQIKKQEWLSEKVRENLQDLRRYIDNYDIQSTVHSLRKLLKNIRPLNIGEVQRLVEKAKRAGELIVGKEVTLLVGETGTGKSTTIQFLAGCRMIKISVQIGPEDFLEHITSDRSINNPTLRNITTSARSKSETRYIAPVTVSLKDIFGPYEHGEIILCDAPGFGDTAGPEVDIANGVGIIEAIKGCESVKILALSSYKSLGDRGYGIQKLIHLLISMVHNIQDRLSSILYGFTKYPPKANISALLLDIKQSTVDSNPLLQSNTAFVAVLTDMIEKSKVGAEVIDPLQGNPRDTIQKLRSLQGIMYPKEVFRFSMSEETQACILNQTQRDSSSVRCALKHKDIDLAVHYLNQLRTLKELLKYSSASDAYEDTKRSVSESIMTYYKEVTKKFNRTLVSQDGLEDEDINEYKGAIDYFRKLQQLASHLGSNLLSPDSLMQNIYSELQKRSQALIEEDLHSHLVGIYFNNILLLKNSFERLDSFYKKICQNFEQRFEKLIESADELIFEHEFKKLAELILKVSKCMPVLNEHLHGLVEENYKNIIQSLLRHLEDLSNKVDSTLAKLKLNENDIEILQFCIKILRTAKENTALQDHISVYVETMAKQNVKLSGEIRSLTEIYHTSIERIVKYFDRISEQISALYQSNEDRALENTETFISDMEAVRKIPEIESKTAGTYYRIVANIHKHVHQLQREVEKLLIETDSQSKTPNYGKIAKILSRLKNAKWMNRISPGTHEDLINRVTEDLIEYFHELEDNLKKLDLSLKYPENVCKAKEIFDQMESISVLERNVPELKKSKDEVIQRFLEAVQINFDWIRSKFELQEKHFSESKQKVNELEKIKQQFENLHPAHVLLRQEKFSDINQLGHEIDNLENKQRKEFKSNNECSSDLQIDQEEQKRGGYSNSLLKLKSIRMQYEDLMDRNKDGSSEQINFLKTKGHHSIESLNKAIDREKKNTIEAQKTLSYDFSDTFDEATANIALSYTTNCGEITIDRVRKNAADAREIVHRYINQYNRFFDREIERLFRNLTTTSPQQDLSQDSENLEMYLEKLISLKEFPHIFECINGKNKTEQWRKNFGKQYQNMCDAMDEFKAAGKNEQLRDLLIIAYRLISVDYFYTNSSLSNGFGALYRKYQLETVTQSKNAYKEVLEKIQKENFIEIENALMDIDEAKCNVKDINMIKQSLHSCLDSLMKKTRKSVNNFDLKNDFTERNENQIQEIFEIIEKVRIVLIKPTIMKFLDEKIKSDLANFEELIKNRFSALLLDELKSIEQFIESDDIFEAEQNMDNFVLVQRELTNHFTLETVSEKLGDLRRKLDSLANDIEKRYDFHNIEKYPLHSPRSFLSKLKRASDYRYQKYAKVHSTISGKVKNTFEIAISNAHEASIERRSVLIGALQSKLQFLPEDLARSFEQQVIDLKKQFEDEEQRYKRDLKEYLENERVDDAVIRRIGKVAAEYQEQKRDEPLRILRSEIARRLDDHWRKIEDTLDKKDTQLPIQSMKEIIKYGEYALNVPEVEQYCERVRGSIMKFIEDDTELLDNTLKTERTERIELAFDNLIVCMELCEDFSEKIENFLPAKVFNNLELRLTKVYERWQQISDTYQISLSDLNIKNLHEIMNTTKKWDGFLAKVQNCRSSHQLIVRFVNDMTNIISYSTMNADLMKRIAELTKQLDVKLMSDETTRFEKTRDDFFNSIAKAFEVLKMIRSEFQNDISLNVNIENIEQGLRKKVEQIKEKLLAYASKDELTLIESDTFRMCYNHLVSLEKHIRLPDVNISHALELAETKILEKIRALSKEISRTGSNVEKVAELLMKIKFFAENFSMFDSKINSMIDEVLKSFKAQGTTVLDQLTMILENADIGSRIIAEHSSLSGEDWRKRRQKMQNQDDLEFILEKLEGDDIATDKLRSRFKTFRRIYDELISSILKSFDPKTKAEPNLTGLISRTKNLFDTAISKTNQIIWNSGFSDKLPEIVAHIFAVWTLKNTQHYNSARGIDASRAYLLMPHVGQVIAVFRILGIGYSKSSTTSDYETVLPQKISKDLVNNLVQIGTGEGKSVVMAVSACVFALMGISVNCSCYSEYLSTRDKTDFTSVFQALGIENRIEYSTFNKLCENFLNEQCNVREKVCDMIMNNKNVINIDQRITRARSKVLLIDEVDVFLSEQFYGGMYTPSVHLKDPTIKALLDALWKNKNLLTLSAIKTLSEYKDCTTRFSNWISLFDEAIKDMIVALQAFQSSTYAVQNDKIVYVEGDSFVENVVRGYDTIWAYYHENQKGFISQTSLEMNVGIIINCGTFSYAQIPTEFTFIAGVSGTLKTLAQQEKKILHDVYHISNCTYMPSVFGESNRNYNPITDVQAVNKKEYFMKIRGEIDAMCNARRAILIFFECEENLLAFYNSQELSSIKESVQIITERVSVKDRELCIKRAATERRATLLTRTFGRGTDFVCRNPQLLANGGIHILQTFFSQERSEEYQIMGRGARQGDQGSYRMILLENDLEWVLGVDWEQQIQQIRGSALYSALDEARSKFYESKCETKRVSLEQRKREHHASRDFMNALIEKKVDLVKTFLMTQNRGPEIAISPSRTLLLMDATGSMTSLLSAAKDTVCTMFDRTADILKEKGLPTGTFQIQFAVYRDYDCKDELLKSSSWETKPNNLRAFIEKMEAKGGGDYEEAIEIGLWHAVEQSKLNDGISQVILIGDAPAKEKPAIEKDRKGSGGEKYWSKTKFSTKTYYKDEVRNLKEKKIPVHTYYLHEGARRNFEYIANETGGRCEFLDIHSLGGAESLTTFVTEEVLRKTAGNQGEAVVKLYREKYGKKMYIA